MAEASEVDFIRNQDGEVLYRQCGRVHHQHLVGRAEELSSDTVELGVADAAAMHGCTQVSHEVEIFGFAKHVKAWVLGTED